MLNFYAKKWREISEECKDATMNISTISLPNNEKILGSILDLTDMVEKLSSGGGKRWDIFIDWSCFCIILFLIDKIEWTLKQLKSMDLLRELSERKI